MEADPVDEDKVSVVAILGDYVTIAKAELDALRERASGKGVIGKGNTLTVSPGAVFEVCDGSGDRFESTLTWTGSGLTRPRVQLNDMKKRVGRAGGEDGRSDGVKPPTSLGVTEEGSDSSVPVKSNVLVASHDNSLMVLGQVVRGRGTFLPVIRLSHPWVPALDKDDAGNIVPEPVGREKEWKSTPADWVEDSTGCVPPAEYVGKDHTHYISTPGELEGSPRRYRVVAEMATGSVGYLGADGICAGTPTPGFRFEDSPRFTAGEQMRPGQTAWSDSSNRLWSSPGAARDGQSDGSCLPKYTAGSGEFVFTPRDYTEWVLDGKPLVFTHIGTDGIGRWYQSKCDRVPPCFHAGVAVTVAVESGMAMEDGVPVSGIVRPDGRVWVPYVWPKDTVTGRPVGWTGDNSIDQDCQSRREYATRKSPDENRTDPVITHESERSHERLHSVYEQVTDYRTVPDSVSTLSARETSPAPPVVMPVGSAGVSMSRTDEWDGFTRTTSAVVWRDDTGKPLDDLGELAWRALNGPGSDQDDRPMDGAHAATDDDPGVSDWIDSMTGKGD